MTTMPNHIPIEYQPGSALRFKSIKTFGRSSNKPCTYYWNVTVFSIKRSGKRIEIPHPWSYELEAGAAQNRLNFSYSNSDEYPERPDYDEENQILWEDWIFYDTEVRFRDEVEAYRLCKSLQGRGIPLFYASGTLDHSNCTAQRVVSTRIILLEYIQDAKTLHDADPVSFAPTIVTSLIATIKSFHPYFTQPSWNHHRFWSRRYTQINRR
ncbi:hypothetical protein F5888DRAFT_1068860 [Russula emetica]|nr:hypothetical protein F5888DRAFT_1068860 [Russula emetica]